MKFTLAWLKEHLDTDAPLERVADALTRVGLEVESVTDRAKALAPFLTARVLEARQHPNADRLRVCMVDTGSGPVQVVCGAPNARTGMIGVFAAAGSVIPGTGLELKAGQIRGEASNGMLVSEREMGLSDAHEGIIDLPEGTPIGIPFAGILGLDDPTIEIGVTPNRPDCLGVGGIARDLAAAGLGALRDRAPAPLPGRFPCSVAVRLDLGEAPELCPAFGLRLIRGVRNGPSPEWLQRRLRAIGLRPINALVDVTNFVTYDRSRPLHVFDAAKVSGDLVIRRAKAGESLLALDGRSHALDATMVVIADDRGVESLAGIMGGEESGCTEATTDVLVESALWDAYNIAQTGRKLGIVSDARYRFERGVDPAFTLPGLELATRMILDLCGGEPSDVVLAGAIPDTTRQIEFPLAEVKRLTGLDLEAAEILDVLKRLGFGVAGEGATVAVTPPSWRPDIEGKADLVEEVMRIVGVDRVPSTPLPREGSVPAAVLTPIQRRTRTAKRALAARGLVEAVTWSFVPKTHAEAFGGGAPEIALANPIAADLSDMRPSLVPGLLAALQRNADRGYGDLALFEVGQVFGGDKPTDQATAATSVRGGAAKVSGAGRHWSGAAGPVDVFDAKADALSLVASLGFPVANVQIAPGGAPWLHPGRSATLRLGNVVLGYFGELHPKTLELLGVDGPAVAAEIILERIPAARAKPTRVKPAFEKSDLQPVTRDFAFLVGARVPAADIVRAAQGADKKLVARVSVFDVYTGSGVGPDEKSLAVEVTLQPRERTMTDAEIDAVGASIVAAVQKATGARLRS